MLNLFQRLLHRKDEQGASAVEYGLLVAAIAALIVVVMGGLGSVLGSLIGSLLIGLTLTLGEVWIASYSSTVMYVLLGIVLLLRPQGILGRRE